MPLNLIGKTMICGTLILDDFQIHFQAPPDSDCVIVTIQDGPSQERETLDVPAAEFMLALGIGFSHAPDATFSPEQWARAERAMPLNPKLRFIP
jgi:hypothetical protein